MINILALRHFCIRLLPFSRQIVPSLALHRLRCISAVINVDMATIMGDQETDSIPGISHMKIFKHRLTKLGRPVGGARDYRAPDSIDVLGIVGGEIVADSQEVL
jgi:hypothetical protein